MFRPAILGLDDHAHLEDWPDYPAADIVFGSSAQQGRTWVDDKAHGLWAGVWQAEANTWRMLDYPVNEFMMILEGEAVIVERDRSTTFRAGDCFVVPKGLHCSWRQQGPVRKVFVIFDDASGLATQAPLGVIRINPNVALTPSVAPAANMLLSPRPVQHTHDYFVDASGQMSVGVWDTTGYERKLIDFPRHELMHLIEGSVTFTGAHGEQRTFNAGDTFFVPMGTPNSWKSEGYLRKIFCIFQPS
jgi:uncharacterized cupin superfamily protein